MLEFLAICAISVMFLHVWHAADPESNVAENGLAIIGVLMFVAILGDWVARYMGWK